jgi:hypothetical protein
MQALDAHAAWLRETDAGRAQAAGRVQRSIVGFLREVASEALLSQAGPLLNELVDLVSARLLDPYEASERLLREVAR